MIGWIPLSGYPDAHIIRLAQHYSRTGEFGNGKSLEDQDELLYEDVKSFLALIARQEWELDRNDNLARSSDDGMSDDDDAENESEQDRPDRSAVGIGLFG